MRLGAVLLILLVAASATAEPFRSERNYLEVELIPELKPAATPVETGAGTVVVATFLGPKLRAAITRINAPNRRAWRKDAAFFREVEAGLAKSSQGYKRRTRRQHKLGKVPALDIDFERTHEQATERVYSRFLFFRTFSVTLMIAVPKRAPRSLRRRVAKMRASFRPYFKK